MTGSRACPHTGGPACRVSGALCCSEIPYNSAWNRVEPVTVCGHEEACTSLGYGEAIVPAEEAYALGSLFSLES